MKNWPLEDHIIHIASILEVPEIEVMNAIFNAFENLPEDKFLLLDEAAYIIENIK